MSFFDLAIRGMSGRAARACFRPLMSGRASVFMLHRIDNHCSGVEGHTIDYVRTALAALKRSGAEFVSVRKLVEAFRGDGPGPNWVALTIDDGFADQALLARAIAESGCPVTVFVISGFLDGEVWPWDDQVTYLLAKSPMRMLEVSIGEQRLMLDLSSQNARRVSICALRTALKRHSNAQIYSFLRTLSEQARVPLPREAPPPFQPMTWEQARALEPSTGTPSTPAGVRLANGGIRALHGARYGPGQPGRFDRGLRHELRLRLCPCRGPAREGLLRALSILPAAPDPGRAAIRFVDRARQATGA
jgi:hypothetical protein